MAYKSNFGPLELFIDGQWQQHKTAQTLGLDTSAVVNLLESKNNAD
jgi:hypothetical protein